VGLGRRWTAAGALALTAAFLPVTSVHAAPAPSTRQLQGANRYATAAAIAAAKFPNGVGAVVLTSGVSFADALAGAYLAGQGPAGMLLTDPGSVPPELAAGLSILHVRNVAIVGGEAAVGAPVENQLRAMTSTASGGGNLKVARTSGASRYDTMQAVDTVLGASVVGKVGGKPTAIVASGANFPDALAAAPVSYKAHLPIVLTDPAQLVPQAAQTLSSLGIQQVLVMGGSGAISDAVVSAITGRGITVLQRFAGADRADTAAQLAAYEVANLGFSNTEIALARGDTFADALAGAQYAGDPKPVLLSQSAKLLGDPTTAYLVAHGQDVKAVTGFGAVGDTMLTDASNAVQGKPTCEGQPCTGGTGVPGTGGLTITPNSVPNDSKDHAVTIGGPFSGAGEVDAWITPSFSHAGFCDGIKTSLTNVDYGGLPASVGATLNVDNGCVPGQYDLSTRVIPKSGAAPVVLVCRACVNVTPAISVTSVNPASVPADGDDGYTHRITLTGVNLAEVSEVDVIAPPMGLEPGAPACSGTVSDLRLNGTALELTLAVGADTTTCPAGKYDVHARDQVDGLDAYCAGCITVTHWDHVVTVDSFTPTTAQIGQPFQWKLTGHGLGHLWFGPVLIPQNPAPGQLKYAPLGGGGPNPATEWDGTKTFSVGTCGVACAVPGSYYVTAPELQPGTAIDLDPPGSQPVWCCITLTPAGP